MRFVNIGLPRSGKTTFWRRLEKEILNIVRAREEGEKEEPSTGVACQRGQVLIRGAKSATGIISAGDWSLLDHDKEIEMLLQFIADIANGLSTDISGDRADESSKDESSYPFHLLNGLSTADESYYDSIYVDEIELRKKPRIEHERRKQRELRERERRKHEQYEHERDFTTLQEQDIYSIINKAMQSDQWDKVKYELEKITLLISTDTGGHAEFLDMYAALVSGPSFNLLFSSLKDDLDSPFKVYFTDENSESTEEYSSDLTVEEVLFPALSSIACFSDSFCATDSISSSIPPADAKVHHVHEALKSCQSKVMFVGTHKDEVSEEEFREKDRVLLERIENTEFYKKGLIEHFDGSQLMLPVDNMYGDEDEMDKIRKRLMEVISSFKKIPIPASWLMLNLIIRSKKCSTMSLEDCEEIAGNLKISKEELQHALWFLHHSVGSLLYYPEVEELKDTVICKVEAMYDSVTNFIAKIYKCKTKNWQAYQKFRKEGQLSLKQVEEATSGAPIPQHKLFKLMQHLNMITIASPSLSDSSTKDPTYFMPCILNSARSTALSIPVAIDGKPPPLMLRYKCGYTPVGVFPAMITNLVSRHLELGWNMIKPSTGLLKNKVEFRVGNDRSKVFLISHFHCFEIAISRSSSEECHSQTTESLCSCVRKVITDTLEVVTSRMNYHFSMEYQYGFECPTHPGKKHLCVLHTNASTCMECIQVPELSPIPLKHHHKMWFSAGIDLKGVPSVCLDPHVPVPPHTQPMCPHAPPNSITTGFRPLLAHQPPTKQTRYQHCNLTNSPVRYPMSTQLAPGHSPSPKWRAGSAESLAPGYLGQQVGPSYGVPYQSSVGGVGPYGSQNAPPWGDVSGQSQGGPPHSSGAGVPSGHAPCADSSQVSAPHGHPHQSQVSSQHSMPPDGHSSSVLSSPHLPRAVSAGVHVTSRHVNPALEGASSCNHDDIPLQHKPHFAILYRTLVKSTAQKEWQDIGIFLGLELYQLEVIESEQKDLKSCLKAMLSLWLNGVDPLPTKSKIIEVLRDLDLNQEAEKLQEELL